MLLPGSPIDRLLPPVLLQQGPRDLLWWQWIALPVIAVVAWLTGALLGRLSAAIAARLARRTAVTWDDELVRELRGPASLAWTTFVAKALIGLIAMAPIPLRFVDQVLDALLFVAFFWALLRAVDVGVVVATGTGWAQTYPQSRSLVPLGSRVAKVAVFAIGIVAVLAEFGYPVASLIAGLGIGGLAVALAAQKTLENLFGAFTIGVDQPFREGDYVNVGGLQGTVEEVGLRSTRIRTLERTVVSIPNGKLAEMQIETFAPRDRYRLSHVLRVEHGTTAAQVRQITSGIEAALRREPKLFGTPSVRFTTIGEYSLHIEIYAQLATTDDGEFQRLREGLLLAFLEVVASAGARLAYPVRVLQQADQKAPAKQ
jgi:MscS family membrane protein